jgi:para-nitrobenzyl esterase
VRRRTLLKSWLSLGVASFLGVRAEGIFALEETPIVESARGRIRGRRLGAVYAFYGIPYGGQVDGLHRFMPAPPVPIWSGVRDCTVLGPRAAQNYPEFANVAYDDPQVANKMKSMKEVMSYFFLDQYALDRQQERQSENCLFLNVLTPQIGTGKRPVMVYLHGGGFQIGSGILALHAQGLPREQDVVLVSVNHRLSVFGYLYLGAVNEQYADSGNAGMLDLILALRWVRDNIGQFGGDPDNVTIFGESGGGSKVSTLLAMPAAHGLLHRAIVQSGSGIWASSMDEGIESTERLLKTLGLGPGDLGKLLAWPTTRLLQACDEAGPLDTLSPVVDGRNLPRHPFSPDAPAAAKGVAMLIGGMKCTKFSAINRWSIVEQILIDRIALLGLAIRLQHGISADIVITDDSEIGIGRRVARIRALVQADETVHIVCRQAGLVYQLCA